jgi:PAS domain S-box-containing protein
MRIKEFSILAGMAVIAITSVLTANIEIAQQRRREPLLDRYTRLLECLVDIDDITKASGAGEESVRSYLLAPDAGAARRLQESRSAFGAALLRLQASSPPKASRSLSRLQELGSRTWATNEEVIAEARAGASPLELRRGLDARLAPLRRELEEVAHELEDELRADNAAVAQEMDRLLVFSHRAVLVASWASTALFLLFGFLLFRLSRADALSREAAETHAAELESILSCLPQAVWVRGPRGVHHANRRALELFGVESPEALDVGRTASFERFRLRSADTGRPIRPEETPIASAFVDDDGVQDVLMRPANATRDIRVQMRAAALRQAERIVGVVVVATDVTEEKEQEHRLQVSEATLAGIISMATDAIIAIDEAQKITLFNRGAERVFGYKGAEILGRSLDVLIPERFRGTHGRHVESFAAGMMSARMMDERQELSALRCGGVEFPAEVSISKFRIDGHLTMVSVLRDITERKRREEELALLAAAGRVFSESLERQETVDHVAQIAVPGLADRSLVYLVASDGRIELAARAPASDVTASPSDDTGASGSRGEIDGVTRAIRTGAVELMANIAERGTDEARDARRPWAPQSILTVPIKGRGRALGALCLMSGSSRRPFDERDARFVEDLANRAGLAIENSTLYADAQRAAELRDEVLAVVAHDLRTPVTSIMASARLLTLLAAQGAEESVIEERIAAIVRASHRLNRLVQDLVDIGRMESGRLVMDLGPVEPGLVVSQVLEEHAEVADKASLQLTAQVADGLPALAADRQRLIQVLGNLVGNALKFTPPGGRIVLGARRDGENVTFWVRDTGPGIPAEHMERLFRRFWQGYAGDRRGVGLGLSICKAIVDAHQGRIWVESQLGFGTTFYFCIPVATASLRPVPASPSTSVAGQGVR